MLLRKVQVLHSGPTEEIPFVMVNCMCQFDWATGCPDILPNIVLDVSVMRLTFGSVAWAQQIRVNGPHAIGWRPEWNKKTETAGIPPVWLPVSWDIGFFLPLYSNWNIFLGLKPAGLQTGAHTVSSRDSQALRPRLESALPGLQLANCRPWDFSAFHNHVRCELIYYNK